jgi:NAD(P)H-nitrite reductase large subunit
MTRYLILGAGVAGRRAAEVIIKKDKAAEITIVDEAQDPFYYKPLLGASLAKGLQHARLIDAQRRLFDAQGVRLLAGAKVTSIDTASRTVSLGEAGSVRYDTLLVACGRKTARPPWASDSTSGVFLFDCLQDAQGIVSTLAGVHRAVVYGPGIQALDALRGLRSRGVECLYLLDSDRLWPGVLDPVASDIVCERLRQEGVTVVFDSRIERLEQEGGAVKAVVTAGGERIAADMVIVAAPQTALHDFLLSSDLDVGKGLVVDASLRTNREGVFAAGDVAEPVLATPQGREHGLQVGWLNAWRQGGVAGTTMCGGSAEYSGIPSVRTKVLDLDVVCLGMTDARGEGIREESGGYPYPELPYIYKKIVYQKGKVAGALLLGDVSEAGRLEGWVREAVPADRCEASLIDQMFNVRSPKAAAVGALCPVCKFQIQVEDSYREGDVVTCPACGIDFRLRRMPNGVFAAEPVRG